jgi:hypothetical protein
VDAIELSDDEEQRRIVLVHKLTHGSINLTEARELRALLEKETTQPEGHGQTVFPTQK